MDELSVLRQQIDNIDNQILELLSERFSIVKKIGDVKKQSNLPLQNSKREEEIIESLSQKAKANNLPKSLIEKVWRIIFAEASNIQKS